MLKFAEKEFFTDPGSPIKVNYSPKVLPDGTIELVEDGIEDWQAYIDSFRDSSEIAAVVARFINTGDPTVFDVKQGVYGDFTQFPKTYAEALQLKIDADRMYNALPVEIKEKFDNDANKFFALSGTDEWYKNLGPLFPQNDIKKESEVNNES